MTSSPMNPSAAPIQQRAEKIASPAAASEAMPPPAGSPPPRERHTRATECARLIPVTTSRDSWRSHVHRTYIPQAAQFFEPKTANVRGRGGRPLVFLSGDLKGDTLFEKRVSPFVRQWRSAPHYPYSAARCNLPSPFCGGWEVGARCHLPSPAKGGIKRDTLFEKRVSPFDFRSLHRCRIIS